MPRNRIRPIVSIVLLAVITATALAQKAQKPEESWDAVFIGQDKVGYIHTTTQHVRDKGKPMVHVRNETVMSMKRFGQAIELKLDYNSFETPDGKLRRVDNIGLDTRTQGEVQGRTMKLVLTTPGKQTPVTIPWTDDVIGPHAEDQTLKKQPLKPGESRSFRTFMPDLNQVITTTMHGEEMEETTLLDGSKQKLQRIRTEIDGIPALKNMKTYLWVDTEGETIKTHTDMLGGMTTYRVTREVAMAPASTVSADFGLKTLVKVDKKIPNPYDTTEVVYRIELQGSNPAEVFPQDNRQSIAKDENGNSILTIRSVQPGDRKAEPPAGEFLGSNNWLQTDNPKVVQATRAAVGDARDPWEKAVRIENWVFKNLTEKNFSKAFDSAAVVADKLEGDCTEHAVLLSAMARVAKIPSRVAIGLVYADRLGAFGYHMWSEVYVGGEWIPLDGTLGRGHASPAHIKIADSSLDGVDATAAFLPVIPVMDRLKIEVVSWKPETN